MRRHAILQETASLVSAVLHSSFESRLSECVSDWSLRSARIKYQYIFHYVCQVATPMKSVF
jgi:hypothetical protein